MGMGERGEGARYRTRWAMEWAEVRRGRRVVRTRESFMVEGSGVLWAGVEMGMEVDRQSYTFRVYFQRHRLEMDCVDLSSSIFERWAQCRPVTWWVYEDCCYAPHIRRKLPLPKSMVVVPAGTCSEVIVVCFIMDVGRIPSCRVVAWTRPGFIRI